MLAEDHHNGYLPLVTTIEGRLAHFTDGIELVLELASEAAGGKDVALAGGANVAQQYLAAGLIDEMEIHIVPIGLPAPRRLA